MRTSPCQHYHIRGTKSSSLAGTVPSSSVGRWQKPGHALLPSIDAIAADRLGLTISVAAVAAVDARRDRHRGMRMKVTSTTMILLLLRLLLLLMVMMKARDEHVEHV